MKTPAMKTPALATVYLDNANVGLMGDPRPRVSKILAAGGKQPGTVQVVRAYSANDPKGEPVGMEDIIDRTADPARPIYLRCRPNAVSVQAPDKPAPSYDVVIDFPPAKGGSAKPLGDPRPDLGGRKR